MDPISPLAEARATATDTVVDSAFNGIGSRTSSSKRFARRLLNIGENRLELLTVDVQEEREYLREPILPAIHPLLASW